MDIVVRLVCLVIGYIFGTFQTAVLYGKLKGVDIRKMGSGNAGTTNTLRVLGTKAGAIVLLGDMIKCIIAVVLVTLLFGKSHSDMIYLLKIYAALGCVLGHDFPVMLKFKGGKGIACTAGYMCAMHPSFIPMFLIVFLVVFNITFICPALRTMRRLRIRPLFPLCITEISRPSLIKSTCFLWTMCFWKSPLWKRSSCTTMNKGGVRHGHF